MKNYLLVFLFFISANMPAAPFQNLGFEEANTNNLVDLLGGGIPADPQLIGSTADLIPGWQGLGSGLGFNLFPAGLNYATLVSQQNRLQLPIDSKYALVVAPDFDDNNFPHHLPASLWQVGDIPANARSIHFQMFGNLYELRVNGNPISLSYQNVPLLPPIIPDRQFALGAGDISAFAGQTVELRFTTADRPFNPTFGSSLNGLDSIFFSPEPIPEPSTWLLLGLGASALWAKRKMRWPS